MQKKYILFLIYIYINCPAVAQRVTQGLYFHEDSSMFALDIGSEWLKRTILINNKTKKNVSFELSIDKKRWTKFGLEPNHCSLYNLYGNSYCYIKYPYFQHKAETTLNIGHCYLFRWNVEIPPTLLLNEFIYKTTK